MKFLTLPVAMILFAAANLIAQTESSNPEDYVTSRVTDAGGREIVGISVPGRPPLFHREPAVTPNRSAVMLTNVPAFDWVFGCSATSAAMAAGYYDNNGYPDMYTGPVNGGVMPMNNSAWGTVYIGGETRSLCPLSATMNGLDGRTTRGHVDDYWVQTNSTAPDPYVTNGWTQHTYGDCTGDFMGTNQSAFGNIDGGTTFFFYTNGSPLHNYTGGEPGQVDGCHGWRDFYESRGYTVIENYSQYIYGYEGNTLGFTFQQYKDEIDAGRPVMIQVSGHSMLGVGYDDSGNTVYLHDTWDYNLHSMTWGGSYAGMTHYAVTIVELNPETFGPVADFTVDTQNPALNTTVYFTDLSTGYPSPSGWSWSITPATFAYVNSTSASSRHPRVQFSATGAYTVSLTATSANGSDTETKTDYINVYDCSDFTLPFSEDFAGGTLPPCWSLIDHQGNGQVWRFDNPGARTIGTSTAGNGFAILDSDFYGGGNSQNCDLVSPVIDMTYAFGVVLSFQHHFQDYEGSSATLSCSTDGGTTWSVLQAWTGSTSNPATYSQDISALAANQSSVRFKWNYTGTWGWYWAIDDIVIHTNVPGLWTGMVSGAWSLGDNWSDGNVPGSSTDVNIHPLAQNWPGFNGNLAVGASCGDITIPGGGELTVNGDLSVNYGSSLVCQGDGLITVDGSWNNQGTFTPGNGTVCFTGGSASTVSGSQPVVYTIPEYTRSTFPKSLALISGGTAGPTGDDASAWVPIGFSFNYAGGTYTQAYISTNGFLTFGSVGMNSASNGNLFTTSTPNSTIAPWWDDLKADGSSSISYKTEGTAPDRVFTAEWKSVLTYTSSATSRITFQLKLFESTHLIEFHYGSVSSGTHSGSASASIGMEDNIGGSGHFMEGTTGSTTTGISNLKSNLHWPTVNYRFSPPVAEFTESFHHLVLDNAGGSLDFNVNTVISGELTVMPGGAFTVTSGKTLQVEE